MRSARAVRLWYVNVYEVMGSGWEEIEAANPKEAAMDALRECVPASELEFYGGLAREEPFKALVKKGEKTKKIWEVDVYFNLDVDWKT